MTLYVVSESRAESYIGDPDVKNEFLINAKCSVNPSTVKLPTFFHASSRLLVSTSGNNKRQFALHGVTSDTTKFYHVFASIDQNAAQHLMDIIAKPPEVSCPKRQEKNGFLKFCAEWVVFFVED